VQGLHPWQVCQDFLSQQRWLSQGYIGVDSLGLFVDVFGFRYYFIFIDDYSRKNWIFFMKKKDEVLSRFVEFKALVENQTNKKIKALRSDNRGEYISNAFRDLCAKEGIRRELTAPHNPQQNGVDECKNCSIMGAAKAMLHD
jgi:transposase InsO family protein